MSISRILLGVVLDLPVLGLAKNLHILPELGDISRKSIAQHLQEKVIFQMLFELSYTFKT